MKLKSTVGKFHHIINSDLHNFEQLKYRITWVIKRVEKRELT